MTPERFGALADAYGGDVDRWPSTEREAARTYGRGRSDARAVLDAAAELDAVLAAWRVPGPGAALAARIAAVTVERRARLRKVRLWLSSLGAATSLAGGLATGATGVVLLAPTVQQSTALYDLSVFGATWNLEVRPSADGGR